MMNNNDNNNNDDDQIRDIHALTPPLPLPPSRRQAAWDTASRQSSNLSVASDLTNSSENFTTMSREFNALVLAGSTIENNNLDHDISQGRVENGNNNNNISLDRIREDEDEAEDSNPFAIVPDNNPLPSPSNRRGSLLGHLVGTTTSTGSSNSNNSNSNSHTGREITVHRVKKEEVETKIMAWQTAKVAKINNRFKREDAIINGWENEQVHTATSRMKKVERKLEEKRAKAMEKMQNNIAKAHRKAEERRASAEGKRGTKVARVLEIANLMRAVGRPPAKRSLF